MKILIPVDGSDHADAALDFVGSRSTQIGEDPVIHLLNVQAPISARVTRSLGRKETTQFQRAQGDEVLQPALARLKRAGITARASYPMGNRPDAIGMVADRSQTDLIVMGSRRRQYRPPASRGQAPWHFEWSSSRTTKRWRPATTKAWRAQRACSTRRGSKPRLSVCEVPGQAMQLQPTHASVVWTCLRSVRTDRARSSRWSWVGRYARGSVL